jgi:hypothetical protein
MQRVQMWVENEQSSHWQQQLRKRQDALVKAKEALRLKQIFKDVTGARQSYVDEEKAVSLALRRLQEAEQKLVNVKRWTRQLEKEINLYKGSVQRLNTTVSSDVPKANAKLDRMFSQLQEYVAIAPSEASSTVGDSATEARMSRPEAGPPQPGEVYRALRQQTPSSESRERIGAGALPGEPWQTPELQSADLSKLAQLPLSREPVDPNGTLTLAEDIAEARRVYLERVVGGFTGDTGWHLGPADGTVATGHITTRVHELLAARPSLADILQLPAGTLIVVDSAGIAALLDSQNQNLWETTRATDESAPTQSSVLPSGLSLRVEDSPQS